MERIKIPSYFFCIFIVGLLFRTALFAVAIILPIADEQFLRISPLEMSAAVDFSFYSQTIEMFEKLGVRGLLHEFVLFYQRPVDVYLGPIIAGPVFPILIEIFDYREGNTFPLSLFFLALSIGLLFLWLRFLYVNGVSYVWLLAFALVPNPIWFMLNLSTDLLYALFFTLFYLFYFKSNRRSADTAFWLTMLLLALLTRPNAYSIMLFVFFDYLIRLRGSDRNAIWAFIGIGLLTIIFGLYLYPYFITEMAKTYRIAQFCHVDDRCVAVNFFGIEQKNYTNGIFAWLPAWLDIPASWLALVGAKVLYFCGLRPSYAEVEWYLILARGGVGLILLPGLLFVLLLGDIRHRLMLICYLIPIFLGWTQDRYNLAVQPVLFLFGVKAIDSVWNRLRWSFAAARRPRA